MRNPGVVLASAIASMVDAHGRILVDGLRPPPLSDAVRRALAGIVVGGNPGEPAIDVDYGEPGLTPAERVFGWNKLEVLAFKTGNPEKPGQRDSAVGVRVHAIALRRRHRLEKPRAQCCVAISTNTAFRGRDRGRARGACDARRPGRSLGHVGARLARADHRQGTGAIAESRRRIAQRRVRRYARTADDLGAAFLSGLLAACAGRAYCSNRSCARGCASWRGCSGISARTDRHCAAHERQAAAHKGAPGGQGTGPPHIIRYCEGAP